jgi:hypothetical protein
VESVRFQSWERLLWQAKGMWGEGEWGMRVRGRAIPILPILARELMPVETRCPCQLADMLVVHETPKP